MSKRASIARVATNLEELAFNEAMRSLDHQRSKIDSLVTRCATLTSVAGASVAFLAGTKGHGLGDQVFLVEMLVCFVVIALLGAMVAQPRRWAFTSQASPLIQSSVGMSADESADAVRDAHRSRAFFMEKNYVSNKTQYERILRFYEASLAFFVAEVVFGTIRLL